MNAPFSGGCACGAIRYECAGEPLAMLNCHCLDCQRSSGAPFASGVIVATRSLTVSGAPSTHTAVASSGAGTRRSFCPKCGSPLFTTGEAMPDFTSIRFTTFDEPGDFRPALDIWTSRAAPWVCLNEELPKFARSPENPKGAA